jgi:hypothetical protein
MRGLEASRKKSIGCIKLEVEFLPNSMEVHHENSGFVSRDGSGRLRLEETYGTPFATQLTTTVFVAPVLRCAYTLDSRNGKACELVPTWPSPADPGTQKCPLRNGIQGIWKW